MKARSACGQSRSVSAWDALQDQYCVLGETNNRVHPSGEGESRCIWAARRMLENQKACVPALDTVTHPEN